MRHLRAALIATLLLTLPLPASATPSGPVEKLGQEVDRVVTTLLPPSPPPQALAVSGSPGHHNATPGTTVTSTVHLHARENATATLNASAPRGWTATLTPAKHTMVKGDNRTSVVDITIPPDANGTHTIVVDVAVQGSTERHAVHFVVHLSDDRPRHQGNTTHDNATANTTRSPPPSAQEGSRVSVEIDTGDAQVTAGLRVRRIP